ncbi:hypothetical protein L3V83_11655 [Thiotrichales bacterium 19X7-9]|nr:hypothetical protein [Thiotrichales bacterium 19X7-9]
MTNVLIYSKNDLKDVKELITKSKCFLYRANEGQTSEYIKKQFTKDLNRQGQLIGSENRSTTPHYEYYMSQLLDIKVMFAAGIKLDEENLNKRITRNAQVPEETYIDLSECKKQFVVSNNYGDKITIKFDTETGVTIHPDNPDLLSSNKLTILQLFEQSLLAYPDHKLLTEIKKSQSQLIEQILNEPKDNVIKSLNSKVFQLEDLCKDIFESDKSITTIQDEFNEIMKPNTLEFPFYQQPTNIVASVSLSQWIYTD